jgi:hypothetical protein
MAEAQLGYEAWQTPFARAIYAGLPIEPAAKPYVPPPYLATLTGDAFTSPRKPYLFTAGRMAWQDSLSAVVDTVEGIRTLDDPRGMFRTKWQVTSDDADELWYAYERDKQGLTAFLALEVAGQSGGTLELRDVIVNRGSLEIIGIIAFVKTVVKVVAGAIDFYPKALDAFHDLREAARRTPPLLGKPSEQLVRKVKNIAAEIAQRLRAFFGGMRIKPA